MTAWDISTSGVQFVTSLVEDAITDMEKHVKAYGKDVKSAAGSSGTIAGVYCGAVPTGPIAAALRLFVEKTAGDVLFLGARAAKSVNGAREATAYYVLGDLDMATRTQHQTLAVPKIDMPGRGGGTGQDKEHGKQ
ncbi:DUF6507 family protein [Streptomyces sp. Ru72]|uniref:DUF6507 family protein n=1 Tax=Streptomyces sp. Ru72 TaxID=2080747 RepID=UPI000CDCF4FA|nr:DUF6507 family protein [Streptomyces sp. Ru72]POX52596.1 hypothetical protein C3488_07675 [Streptomyces sp. Ru72]